MLADYNGESATIAGAIMGGLFGAFDAITQGLSFSQTIQYALSGAITGAIAGFVADVSVATAGLGTAVLVSAAASGIMGGAHSIITDVIRGEDVDWGKAAVSATISAGMGALGTAATTSATAPITKGISNGIRHAWNTLKVEVSAMMTRTLPKVVNQLSFDTIVSGVTNFGNWLYSKVFTS